MMSSLSVKFYRIVSCRNGHNSVKIAKNGFSACSDVISTRVLQFLMKSPIKVSLSVMSSKTLELIFGADSAFCFA